MKDDLFSITESPVPVHAWEEEEGSPPLDTIEGDIRALMRELAEVRLSQSEVERAGEDRVEEILLRILEAIDAFERVFRSIHARQDEVSRQMKIWVGNFRTVKRLLDALLEQEGVKPIENLQGGFDPHWHKVADTVSDPSEPDGAIVEETRRGYVRGTKILRKSEVVVVQNEK